MKPTRLSLILVIMMVMTSAVFAAGTPEGTVISNQASAAYEDARGQALTAQSNTVTTTVDFKVGATLTDAYADANGNSAEEDMVVNHYKLYAIKFTNTSNGNDTYDLAAAVSSVGGGSSATTDFNVELFLDANGNGLLDPGDDATTSTGLLAADAEYDFIAKVSGATAAGNTKDAWSVITVTATSGHAAPDDLIITETYKTTVIGPSLTSDINFSNLTDPGENPTAGDIIEYTICVSNAAGTDAAHNVVVTADLPDNTSYISESIVIDGDDTITDATDGDDGEKTGTAAGDDEAIAARIGDVAVGATICVKYQVTVDASVGGGDHIEHTPVPDIASDNGEGTSNPVIHPDDPALDLVVPTTYAVSIEPASAGTDTTVYAEPNGFVFHFIFSVTNNGNDPDSFTLSATATTNSYGWTYYVDANRDGVPDDAGSPLTTTASISELGGVQYYVAVGTLPDEGNGANEDTYHEVITFTATSVGNNTVSDGTDIDVTTKAPIMTTTLSSDVAEAKPGEEIEYTITVTNSGTGTASDVVVTNVIPTNTTYTDAAANYTVPAGVTYSWDAGSSTISFTVTDPMVKDDTYTMTFKVVVD